MRLRITAIVLFGALQVSAQSYRHAVWSVEEGLSQSTVFAMMQDRKGMLWIGTEDGLNRFDGYQFSIYRNEPFDSTSLAGNEVRALLEDSKGRIWVGQLMHGVNLLDPHSGKFRRLRAIQPMTVSTFLEDPSGLVWIGGSAGLFYARLDEERPVLQQVAPPKDIKGNWSVRSLLLNPDGTIWAGANQGLWQYDRRSGKWSKQFLPAASQAITALFADARGRRWVAAQGELFAMEPAGGWQRQLPEAGKKALPATIAQIAGDLNGNIWVATLGAGLFKQSCRDSGACNWTQQGKEHSGLASNHLRSVMPDRFHPDMLWIGHSVDGLEQVIWALPGFRVGILEKAESEDETRYAAFARSLMKDPSGTVWIGADDGLYRQAAGQPIRYFNPAAIGLSAPSVSHIIADDKSRVWACTNKELNQVLFAAGKLSTRPVRLPEAMQDGLSVIHKDSRGVVWVAGRKHIGVFDPDRQQIKVLVNLLEEDQHTGPFRIFCLYSDAKKRLWVGSNMGLILTEAIHDPTAVGGKISFQWFRHDPADLKSLRSHNVLSVLETQKHGIWLGTLNGLIQVTEKDGKQAFKAYSEKDGMANNVVYGLLEDTRRNHIWLSTNKGLSRFNPDKLNFEHFDVEDGLPGNEFNSGAYFQAEDGEMLFGGVKGFVRFYPGDIHKDTIPPLVWITAFVAADRSRTDLLYNKRGPLRLSYRDNTFSIEFTGISYRQSRRNSYAYRLKGYQDEWVYCGENRQAFFSKLHAGKFVFQVMAANADGVWNPQGDLVEIVVKPPFWQTGWFFGGMLILVAAGLFLLHRIQVRAQVRRVMELERVRRNAAADFHDELGHKLTVIALFGEILKKKLNGQADALPQLNKMIENANSLYYAMKDLLWVLDPNKDAAYDLAILLRDFGHELFDSAGIEFHAEGINPDMKQYQLPMDHKRHIALIFKEAMNNALRHSGCSSAHLLVEITEGQFCLRFSDNGKGYDPGQAALGNGLHNINARAQKIGAGLEMSSRPGETLIRLCCPIEALAKA